MFILRCDTCHREIPAQWQDFGKATSWFQLRHTWTVADEQATRQSVEFCSRQCLRQWLHPMVEES